MMPISGANSGIVKTFVSRLTSPKPPAPTPAIAMPIGRPMASTDPNDDDQHDDGEGQADQLRLGWFELAERGAADLDPQPVDIGDLFGDLLADRRRLGVVDVVGEVDLRVRDRSVVADLLGAERGVRADRR